MGAFFSPSGQVESSGSGTIGALNATVVLTLPASAFAVLVVSGTWSATLIAEGSVDGTNYFTIQALNISTGQSVTTITANTQLGIPTGGLQNIRLRASAYSSGTATVTWNTDTTENISSSTLNITQVGGAALSEGQKAMSASIPVTIASDQSAVPASQSGTWTVQQGGTPTSVANSWPVKLTDGTDTGLITTNGDQNVADISNNGGSTSAITVGTSALIANVSGAANLINRKYLSIFNNGSATIYWGTSNGVTTSSGTPIAKNQQVIWAVGPNTSIYLISGSAGQNVRVVEMA